MTATERKACVIGWPISHSRSPIIHNHWLRHYGIPGRYDRVPVRPEDLSALLGDLRVHGYVGCNVTVPHKEEAFRLVEAEGTAARRTGTVNTVYLKGGRPVGRSTDGEGFLESLRAGVPGWSPERAAVALIGAGGAARAVAAALADAGVGEIAVFNRTPERAFALAADLGPPLAVRPWGALGDFLSGTDLLVNTTSLGMAGQPSLVLPLDRLRRETVVADIVYVPLETPLLASARARGNRTVDGLGMLMHQAVPGFELWFGVRPEVTPELRALVAADIANG
ncbi:MAG: shikimate dehydrogenase [Parvibaculaceae bacterium]